MGLKQRISDLFKYANIITSIRLGISASFLAMEYTIAGLIQRMDCAGTSTYIAQIVSKIMKKRTSVPALSVSFQVLAFFNFDIQRMKKILTPGRPHPPT